MITENQKETEKEKQLDNIIVNNDIIPVFQPIISLKDGTVLGFEALSRIRENEVFEDVEELFRYAEKSGRIWQLEQVCRRIILHEVFLQKEHQDLLKKAMEIEVDLAKSANPLTGLPGNIVIDQKVKSSVESGDKYKFFYFDLDNFKAFNDVYGFDKGDEIIKILAEILKGLEEEGDFVGHIGGDDFVMICKGYKSPEFSMKIRLDFEKKAHLLYTEEDRAKQYIIAKNRHGVVESFPLVSVTIVSLSNEKEPFGTPDEVSNILAKYKKAAKAEKRTAI